MDENANGGDTSRTGPDRSGYNHLSQIGDFIGPPREHYLTSHSRVDATSNFSKRVVDQVTKLAIRLIKHTSPQLLKLRLESPYLIQPYYVNNGRFAWVERLISRVNDMRDHLHSKYQRTSLLGPLSSHLNWFNPLRRQHRHWLEIGEDKSADTALTVNQPEPKLAPHPDVDLSLDDFSIDIEPFEKASLQVDAHPSGLLKDQADTVYPMALTEYHPSPLHEVFRPTILKAMELSQRVAKPLGRLLKDQADIPQPMALTEYHPFPLYEVFRPTILKAMELSQRVVKPIGRLLGHQSRAIHPMSVFKEQYFQGKEHHAGIRHILPLHRLLSNTSINDERDIINPNEDVSSIGLPGITRQENSSNRSPLTRTMLRTNADKLRDTIPFSATLNRAKMPLSQLHAKTHASLLSTPRHELDIFPSPTLFSSRDSFSVPSILRPEPIEKGAVALTPEIKEYPRSTYVTLSKMGLFDAAVRSSIEDSSLVSIEHEKATGKDMHSIRSEPDLVLASVAWMTEKQPSNVNTIGNEPPLAAITSPGRGSVTQPYIALASLDRGDYNGRLEHSVAKEPGIGTSSENQNVVPTIDADSLANDVYRILKLRLAVEKERSFFGGY